MSIAERLTTIAENQQKVYDAGYAKGQAAGGDTEGAYNEGYKAGQKAEHARFWDAITCNGTRTDYSLAFARIDAEEVKPPSKIAPSNSDTMFAYSTIKKVGGEYFDFTQVSTKKNNVVHYCVFMHCANLEDLSESEFATGGHYYTFYNCRKLHSTGVINVAEDDRFTDAFAQCPSLEKLTVKGTIGQVFNVAYSPINHDSAMSVINALKDLGDTGTKTVYFSSTTKALLTDVEKAIATEKGWTIG